MINQKRKTEKCFKYSFFIGSNNDTKKTEPFKAIEVLKKFSVMAYTITENLKGYWNNTQEDSFKIDIIATAENPINEEKVRAIKTALETDLKQYLVLTEKTPTTILI
jgi:hypothetical protein